LKGKVPPETESWSPLGMRGEESALSERMNPPGKTILAAAAKTL